MLKYVLERGIFVEQIKNALYKLFLKRLFDIILSFTFLILISPIFLLVTFLLTVVNQGSPFFIQARPGRKEIPFPLIKFKTMNDKCDTKGVLLPDELRLTTVGRIVRATSLDEIPQLLNVLAGQMSLIGPRPLLQEYLPLYSPIQRRRHEVLPGITGWAQVNGRNAISWEMKFALDAWYVDNISFSLDMKIMWWTLIRVIKSEGIRSSTSSTMEKFEGNKNR